MFNLNYQGKPYEMNYSPLNSYEFEDGSFVEGQKKSDMTEAILSRRA